MGVNYLPVKDIFGKVKSKNMKPVITLLLFLFFILPVHAQNETYDLLTYKAPLKWTKDLTDNNTSYTITNKKNNTWCRIGIIKSTISKGNIEADFESEWKEIIVKIYNPVDQPTVSEVKDADGWKIKAGNAKFIFNKKEALALLTTASGYNRCMSIVAVTNSQVYLKDIEALLASINLIKPEIIPLQQETAVEITTSPVQQTPVANNSSILGSWGKSNTVSQVNNRYGNYSYNKQQYTFNANGTYYFNAKNYSEQYSETLLIKESGTYVINGTHITITPKNSIIEAWSKKNGGDNWNQLKTTQKRSLEKANYQFSIDNKNLQLQIDTPTERDGTFNSGNIYSYGPPGTFTPIKLPGE